MGAQIVIDLGYGDSGKGITVDHLCEKADKPVVDRFSGGPQAGHTVCRGSKKHTFSNFGAASFQGVPTYFSEHTTIYPIRIQQERDILATKGVKDLTLTIHPLARVTTPFDIFANRGCGDNLDHGTCGLGVGKTHKRHNESGYKIFAVDLLNTHVLSQKMARLAADYHSSMFSEDLKYEIEAFMKAVKSVNWNIQDYSYLNFFKNIVFESSQGVLLEYVT